MWYNEFVATGKEETLNADATVGTPNPFGEGDRGQVTSLTPDNKREFLVPVSASQAIVNELVERLNELYREKYQREGREMSEAVKDHPALAWAEKFPHRVPDSAVVPIGVEVALFSASGTPAGASKFSRRTAGHGVLRYTAEPIESPKPDPEPEPNLSEVRLAPEDSKYLFAVLVSPTYGDYPWYAFQRDGSDYRRLTDEDVADWVPAEIVAKEKK